MKQLNLSKEYLEKLINELCENGEDKKELSMWTLLYDAMSDDERKSLIENLENELIDLQKLQG